MNSAVNSVPVVINGKTAELPCGAVLADAVRASGVQPPFAAAVNLQFVPRSQYATTPLRANDQIELISPVTGG